MKTNNPSRQKKQQASEEKLIYETPAIIHESSISTRAGTPIEPDDAAIDPADLFGG